MRILSSLITHAGVFKWFFFYCFFFITTDHDSTEFSCSPGPNRFLNLEMYNDSKPQQLFPIFSYSPQMKMELFILKIANI